MKSQRQPAHKWSSEKPRQCEKCGGEAWVSGLYCSESKVAITQPESTLTFDELTETFQKLDEEINRPWLELLEQFGVKDDQCLVLPVIKGFAIPRSMDRRIKMTDLVNKPYVLKGDFGPPDFGVNLFWPLKFGDMLT